MNPTTVLVIEDDNDIRTTLKMLLELEGYRVFTAQNGREGLELLSNCPEPCLILLDMMMPEMNGWEFMEVRRHTQVLASIPVIVVSAAASMSGRPGLPPGTDGYIKKPVDLEKLLAEVSRHCPAGIRKSAA